MDWGILVKIMKQMLEIKTNKQGIPMQIACRDCDLLVQMSDLDEGNKEICPRCGNTLTAKHHNANDRVIAFSLAALIFFILSFFFSFLTLSAQGQGRTVSLVQSITVLVSEQFTSLAVIVFIFVIVIPGVYLFSILYTFFSLKFEKLLPETENFIKLIGMLGQWSMSEIFLISILVSFIKIAFMAEVSLGLSFWSYTFFIIAMSSALLHIDKHQLWLEIKAKKQITSSAINSDDYIGCEVCTEVLHRTDKKCSTCGSRTQWRKKDSLQKTWALLITSFLLYIPANFLPIMNTRYFGEETANTILGGVMVLWEHGSYPIAIIIFIASFLLPLGKMFILTWLCYGVQTKSERSFKQKTQLYRVIELVGRWSMVDVFVVAVLVALIKMGEILSVYPDWGAVAFSSLVIVTIFAAQSFDPRLIWGAVNKVKNS